MIVQSFWSLDGYDFIGVVAMRWECEWDRGWDCGRFCVVNVLGVGDIP